MKKRYIVKLTAQERECLEVIVDDARQAKLRRSHSQILLLVDEGEYGPSFTDVDAADQASCTRRTMEQVRERCVMQGLSSAQDRKKQSGTRSRKLDGEAEAALVQLACSDAPEGHARWTLHLLSSRLVEQELVDNISSVCATSFKKNIIKPWKKQKWCIPLRQNAAFVCQMESVLETYKRARDPLNPVVCMEETTKQCTQEVRQSIKAKPGTVERYDGEYIRNGVGHLILFYSPLDNWCRVQVADNHKACEWAEGIIRLVEEDYAEAEKITLVMDNLSTHSCALLYTAFPQRKRASYWRSSNLFLPPKHGSWLYGAAQAWPNVNSACWCVNAWIDGYLI